MVVCVPNNRLQMSVFTNADGFGFVPARLPVSPHDASEGWVSLQCVAAVAVVGDSGAQLEVGPHPCPVAHQARLEARLPGVLCVERQHGGKSATEGSARYYSIKGDFVKLQR